MLSKSGNKNEKQVYKVQYLLYGRNIKTLNPFFEALKAVDKIKTDLLLAMIQGVPNSLSDRIS